MSITIPGSVLQNGLKDRLPEAFFDQFPGSSAIAYSIIPFIPTLEQPLKDEVRVAFAESLRTVWVVFTAFAGVGLISSLPMKGLRLHTQTDGNWNLETTSGEVSEPTLDDSGKAILSFQRMMCSLTEFPQTRRRPRVCQRRKIGGSP